MPLDEQLTKAAAKPDQAVTAEMVDELARIIRLHHITRQIYDGPGKTRSRRLHQGDKEAACAVLAAIDAFAATENASARIKGDML